MVEIFTGRKTLMGGKEMKKFKFTGTLTYYKRLNCSIYGNPAFYGEFENENGDILRGRTATNSACAYGFLNYETCPREITYHVTRIGNVIFDYIKVLEG